MKRSVVIKRLGYEASAGWTTYGTSLAAFSLFQGVARDMKAPAENQPRRNEEHEGLFWSFLRPLRFFVVDSHFVSGRRNAT